jgi:DNA-binding transcriptional MerR regulator
MRQVSEAARLFGVGRDTVKKWCHEFPSYLSATANPPTGQVRYFTDRDLRVLAVIFYYWEAEPDYEAIRHRLDSGYQDEEMYLEFAYLNTPVFREPPDDIGEEYEYCIMLNGEFLRSAIDVARAYKRSGDALVGQAITSQYHPHELDYPIFFNYRHAIELYLKILADFDFEAERTHDLLKLIVSLEAKYGKKVPEWMKDRLMEFHSIDPEAKAFRYSGSMPAKADEQLLWVDLYQLQTVMRVICEAFEEVIGLPYS